MLLRLDVAEQLASELAWSTRRGAIPVPPGLASRLSIKPDLLPVVLRALGFRILPGVGLGPLEYGPPAPAMLLPLRRRRGRPPPRRHRSARTDRSPRSRLCAIGAGD